MQRSSDRASVSQRRCAPAVAGVSAEVQPEFFTRGQVLKCEPVPLARRPSNADTRRCLRHGQRHRDRDLLLAGHAWSGGCACLARHQTKYQGKARDAKGIMPLSHPQQQGAMILVGLGLGVGYLHGAHVKAPQEELQADSQVEDRAVHVRAGPAVPGKHRQEVRTLFRACARHDPA